jgi:type IV pilus assembly protein PilF
VKRSGAWRLAAAAVAALLVACGSREPRREQPPQVQAPPTQEPVPASAKERARAHTELGAGYYQVAQYKVALEEFKEALEIDPRYVPALGMMGLVYMELKEDDKARQSFEKALKIDPTDADVNNNFGLFLCNRQREKESIRYFVAAARNTLYSSPQEAYANAGVCSRRAGNTAEAMEFFQRAVQLDPGYPRALINLAQLQFAAGQYDRAKLNLSRYMQVTKTPDAPSLWMGVRIERQLGDRPAMMSYSTQLQQRFPDAPETRLLREGRFD